MKLSKNYDTLSLSLSLSSRKQKRTIYQEVVENEAKCAIVCRGIIFHIRKPKFVTWSCGNMQLWCLDRYVDTGA